MSEKLPYPNISLGEYRELYSTKLGEMFDLYHQNNIDVRLIGSLGRTAALEQPLTSFTGEYGGLKDVDIIIFSDDQDSSRRDQVTQAATTMMFPIPVDEHYKGQVLLTEQSAHIRYKDLVKEIDPRVFARQDKVLLGTQVPTLDLNTLFHLTILHGALRPKDLQNLGELLKNMQGKSNILPESFFAPFDELASTITSSYKKDVALGQLRWHYHTKMPISVRRTLSTVTEPIWHAIRKD